MKSRLTLHFHLFASSPANRPMGYSHLQCFIGLNKPKHDLLNLTGIGQLEYVLLFSFFCLLSSTNHVSRIVAAYVTLRHCFWRTVDALLFRKEVDWSIPVFFRSLNWRNQIIWIVTWLINHYSQLYYFLFLLLEFFKVCRKILILI